MARMAAPVHNTWLRAMQGLYTVPEGYREENIQRARALELLRCGESVMTQLIEAGLPCSGARGEEVFDRYDLMNLATYSGSGYSLPERSLRFALRWMSNPAESWFRPVSWRFSVECSCGKAPEDRARSAWTVANPAPGLLDGHVRELTVTPRDVLVGDADIACRSGGFLGIDALIEVRGRPGELRAPVLRDIVAEFLQAGYRWVRLPESLQIHPEILHPRGVATCISASLYLADRFRDSGFEARTRRGWLLGMLDLPHSWLEVVDSDGRRKIVDPAFILLAEHAENPHPGFVKACVGSWFNKVLPTRHEANQPVVQHACGAPACTPDIRINIRKS